MTKGITPVIAIILLLLITIAIIGFATGFFQTLVGTAGGQAVGAANATGTRLQKTIEFVTAGVDSVTVRNAGSEQITAAELTGLVQGTAQTCVWTPATITPGQATTCVMDEVANPAVNNCDDANPAPNTKATVEVSGPTNTVRGLCPS